MIKIRLILLLVLLLFISACSKDNDYKINFYESEADIYKTIIVDDEDALVDLPKDPERLGYEFKGWLYKDDEMFDGKIDLENFNNKELNIYAKWDVKIIVVSFDSLGGESITPKSSRVDKDFILPENPTYEDNTFIGWYFDKDYEIAFSKELLTYDKDVVLYAKWESRSAADFKVYMENVILKAELVDLELPQTYPGIKVTWTSSHSDIIDSKGNYKRPYTNTDVVLQAILEGNFGTTRQEYLISVEGYKDISSNIASSYIYRDYHLVDDEFFDTLDIINTAFIEADVNGNLSGSSFLYNVDTYIMPKARLNGNWVIPSIAPESYWSSIASDSSKIENFANNIVDLINNYGFDGIDIDWEYPKKGEEENFTELMEVVYSKVKANNPKHLVTAAIGAGMWQPARYDLPNSEQYIDYINMMAYSMTSNNGYYQNALYPSSNYNNSSNEVGKTLVSCSIEESVAIYNNYGINNSKIIVGVPFYAIKQVRELPSNNWKSSGSIRNHALVANYIDNSEYTKYFDSVSKVPYLLKKDGSEFISYEDAKSIGYKSTYIIENQLGGIMFWEYGADNTGELLRAIKKGFNK